MIRQLTSPDNPVVKLAASLRQKKYRDTTGCFAVEGVRFAREAIDSGWEMQAALVSETAVSTTAIADLMDRLSGRGCQVFSVPAALYGKISETATPQGISLIVHQRCQSLAKVELPESRTPWMVLDSLQDPGNVGTMIRTADAAGAAGVILAGDCADVYAGKTARATMGSLFHLPVIKASFAECMDVFSRWKLPAYVAGAEAATDYTDVNLSGAFAIVFGNEGAGVGAEFRQELTAALRIPLQGRAESLNVASAAAVILFEAARQRQLLMSVSKR